MILKLLTNEYRLLTQNRVLMWLSLTILILWGIALAISLNEYHQEKQIRQFYKSQQRQIWVQQTPKNPHMAAHYGTFVFKPANPLSLFDKGISTFSGTFIYLEAHRQNDFVGSPAQNSSSYIRMGEFNISFLLQFAIPLLIVAVAAGLFSREKEDGLYSFMTANSVSGSTLFRAKVIALMSVIVGLCLLIFGGTVAVSAFSGIAWTIPQLTSVLALFVGYMLFYWCITSLTLLVSLRSSGFKTAFLLSCFAWIALFFLLPRLVANLSERLYKLPSTVDFRDQVRAQIINGIDGHSMGKREEMVIDSLLKKYHVDSTSQLPVNSDGVLLMKSEAYSSAVYDKEFDALKATISKQQNLISAFGLINPFMSIRNISFAACGNSLADEFDFRQKAEVYRNYYVQELNENMILYSKESEFKTYKVGSEVFGKINDFAYKPLTTLDDLKSCWPDLFVLVALIVLIQFYIIKTVR
ncbi:ABC transporter permease [Spirosoma utsteinense]|uniref:ABC-2 type transport system permease protein n=1 Tax=Spirosoma utsteinense TaxID=2585773 RepID=A0ABR6WGS0_9BACT|nr:ABC transporter permease [Spirosoma utsteinense]MBC3789377.1 ABC-2 type transport system permease protein [Spirosoma utsteinense]MBC3795295.1 ABC-2 type transport system permease protein [Spirosoma utsteinense]